MALFFIVMGHISPVVLTSDMDWDPCFLYSTEDEDYEWFEKLVYGLLLQNMLDML